MGLKALLYAYLLGGITLVPVLIAAAVFFAIYTSVPVGDPDPTKSKKHQLQVKAEDAEKTEDQETNAASDIDDVPKTRKGWLTVRRTFEESTGDGSYVTLVRSFLDARSKDPKRARPKDMWYVVLKGKVLFLYEDETMTDCEGAIELGGHDVVVYPEGLPDGELFAKRNAICLKPKLPPSAEKPLLSLTKEMNLEEINVDQVVEEKGGSEKKRAKEARLLQEVEQRREAAREEAFNVNTPWFIFVRSNIEMEDWYLALVHASDHPPQHPTLEPLHKVYLPSDMNHLVTTLDEQPDVIPMRWLNALLGRIFFSYYRTHALEANIIARLMKKIAKVKRPNFLTDIVVTEVSVGNRAPTFSKPMLKELTKEGDASLEVHLLYKGEVRITIEATATINLGARFKSYTVKLVLAAVLRELEGNLLVKVKRPPSNRIWYAFTQTPRMVLEVEPIVSDRQITWGMILSTIESKVKEIIQESVVLPNMDDIAFFESTPFSHRGGIWSDASRHEHQPAVADTTDEEASIRTAPVQKAFSPPPEELDSDSTPPTRSKSTEPVLTEASESSPSPPAAGLSRSAPSPGIIPEDTTASASSSKTHDSNRRKSWFSSVRSEGSFAYTEDEEDEQIPVRGRTSEAEPTSSVRSQSTPSKGHEPSVTPDVHREWQDFDQIYPDPSVSRSSSTRGHDGSVPADSAFSTVSAATNNSSKARDGQLPNTPTSPTSFLSTLKSRAAAADKQAISNSAKEAMRKWGVNWGGLKKESSDSSQTDDAPDNGSIASRLRVSSNNAVLSKARSSYAEVRAAVAERKAAHRDEAGPSNPIAIPPRSRVTSHSGGQGSGYTAMSWGKDEHQRQALGGSSPSTSFDAATISRSATEPSSSESVSRSSSNQSQSQTTMNTTAVPAPAPPVSPPIHVQPQAKSMTMIIPGIHASHRGEVQAIENVAPAPPQDARPKNPTLQSMYKLWKSPTLGAVVQQGDGSSSLTRVESTGSNGSRLDADVDALMLSSSGNGAVGSTGTSDSVASEQLESTAPTHWPLSPQSIATPTPVRNSVPPPLPPRSTTSTTTIQKVPSSSEMVAPQSGNGAISASDALKSIANKDTSNRMSMDFSTKTGMTESSRVETTPSPPSSSPSPPAPGRPGPPLPPRRVAQTAQT